MRRAAVIVGVAALAVAGWLVWPRGAGVAPTTGETDEAARGDAPRPASASPELARSAQEAREARARRATSAAKGTGALFGVVRLDGAPAAADVELFWRDPEERSFAAVGGVDAWLDRMLRPPARPAPDATTKAGPDGRYSFAGRGRGAYVVVARTSDGGRGRESVEVPADGARIERDVAVSAAGESLAGLVRHVDGRPWRGTVFVVPGGNSGRFDLFSIDDVSTTTDESGRFTARGLRRSRVAVEVLLPGASRVSGRPVDVPFDGTYELVVDEGAVHVEGRVVADADGQPIAGARVAINSSFQGRSAAALATTDALGTFRLELPVGEYTYLLAAAAGFAPYGNQVDPAKPIEVRLSKGGRVEGRVSSVGDGTPIRGALVKVRKSGTDYDFTDDGVADATTDADGRYVVENVPPGEVRASAAAPGWIAEREGRSTGAKLVVVAGQAATIDLRLARGVRASGRVLAATGVPVAGAVVGARREGREDSSFFLDEDGRFSSADPEADPPAAATGADGAFAVEGLRPSAEYVFRASAPGEGPGRAGPVTVSAEGSPAVEIRLAAARHLVVTVVDDANGTPAEGASIEAKSVDAAGEEEDVDGAWTTSRDGRARVGPVPPAPLRLSATLEEFLDGTPVEVAVGATEATLRLRRGAVVTGRVTRPDGTAAAGGGVTCSARTGGSWTWRSTPCGADGTFRLTGLPEGTLDLQAEETIAGRQASGTARAEGGATGVAIALAFERPEEGGLVVRVLDANGDPVASANASFRSGSSTTSQEVAGGRVVFEGVESGGGAAGVVEVWNARGRDGVALAPGRAQVPPDRSEEVVVRLSPGFTISGVVRDEEGKGVADVPVVAREAAEGDEASTAWQDDLPVMFSGGKAWRATSGSDGAFQIGGLADGAYRLRARPRGEYVPPPPVTSRAGASGVSFTLRRGVSVVVTVLDAAGKPVRGAIVRTRLPQGWERFMSRFSGSGTTTDAAGAIRLTGLEAGRECALSVTPPESRGDLLEYAVPSWRPKDETVRLGAGFTLRGVVRDAAGKPVEGASVQRKDADGDWTRESVGDDGRFELKGLPLQPVTLRARVGGGWREGGRTGPEVTVPPGTREVVLTIDPGLALTVRLSGSTRSDPVEVSLLREEPDGRERIEEEFTSGEAVRFAGLSAEETYTVWAHSHGGSRFALRSGVRAGGELALELAAGKAISVRVKGAAAGSKHLSVRAESGGLAAQGIEVGDGRYEVRGLPDGAWNVQAQAWGKEKSLVARAVVEAGGSVELELKPEEGPDLEPKHGE